MDCVIVVLGFLVLGGVAVATWVGVSVWLGNSLPPATGSTRYHSAPKGAYTYRKRGRG